jgi:hypothetical protein
MIAAQLTRYEHTACASCNAFAPDCMVPIDDDSTVPACWICAHMITAHGHTVGETLQRCACPEVDIYPPDIAELRELRRKHDEMRERGAVPDDDRTQSDGVPMYVNTPEFVGRHSKRWAGRDVRSVGKTLIARGSMQQLAGSYMTDGHAPTIEMPRTLTQNAISERERGFIK